ncbi:carbonate dehydratase [Pseudoduganella plicata]|uniref:Carbonic anhydrase 2 n=1 Tax=Pseudoduganella plicata TaxID=321984 RepID=A0A4P7BI32_9BURK|nr:carbonate dehydratase [Pseudoduganella plicata]QBQ37119.1 carbonate dehydratase [Pseudoduganella plicata]GGY99223.1 carbonic anhydrase [Pseudoduganella plicata]
MSDQIDSPSDLQNLLNNNRRWADSMVERDPEFFQRLANQASPEYLWIGCSDSRVPANELLGLLPGDVFVHRNIANVVVHSDLNCLSVLQFAIEVLKVKHVIIVGHYGCKGVHAALTGARVGLVDNWLRHVQDVSQKHERYLGTVLDEQKRSEKLCELNVVEQVVNVCSTTIVRDAWDRGQPLSVHGWVYGLKDGLLHDLGMRVSSHEELAPRLANRLAAYNAAAAE